MISKLFKKKKQKTVIDFYTCISPVYHKAPITKANKQLPKWWKSLPALKEGFNLSTFSQETNMRRCTGFSSLFQHGFTIPMWSDIAFDVSAKGKSGFAYHASLENAFSVETHGQEQRGSYLPESDYIHAKLVSPWAVHCNKDIDWVIVQATWNFDTPQEIIIPPGSVNYHDIADTHINMFIPKSEERKQMLIEYGQPLVHLIPLTEDEVEYNVHLVSKEEYDRILFGKNATMSFSSSLFKSKKLNTCPFHFTSKNR